jgi:hypothetical protein
MERLHYEDTFQVTLRLPECRVMCGFTNLELTQMKGASHHFAEILSDKLRDQLRDELPKLLARG